MPGALPDAVGFPASDGQSIFVSKTDWATLIAREVAIRAWMMAASDCLAARVR